jgi:tetratricopeptide (TPR) repeat protein
MHLQKLVSALGAMDRATERRFGEYMASVYFHHTAYAVELWGYMREVYPNFTEAKVNVALIAKKRLKLKTQQIQARAGSELLRCFEDFVALQQWEQNGRGVLLHKVLGLKNMGLAERASEWYAIAMDGVVRDANQHIDVMESKHLLEEVRLNGFDAKLRRSQQNDIAPVVDTLDVYYALKKLRYQCEAISRNKIFGTALPWFNEGDALEVLRPYCGVEYPYIFLFVEVYKMLLETDYEVYEEHYKKMKDFVVEHGDERLRQTVVEVCDFAVNLSIQWSNRGVEAAAAEYLWWMEWKMRNDFFVANGRLLPITYRNVVSNAIVCKKPVAWLEDFIKTYTPCLPKELRSYNEGFAIGLLQYQKGDYKRAIQSLQTAQAKEDVLYNGVIRRWQYVCLYEYAPDDKDEQLKFLEAFSKFVLRNKGELGKYEHVFRLFIKYAKGVVGSVDGDSHKKLLEELCGEEFFAGKHWLVERLKLLQEKACTKFVQA